MNFEKSILTLVLAVITSFLFVGCKEKTTKTVSTEEISSPVVKKEIASENLQSVSFTIEGMTCAIGCAKTIREELTALDGVQTATVDFDKKLATVTFDKTVQNPKNLTKVVQATGDGKTYTVLNIKS